MGDRICAIVGHAVLVAVVASAAAQEVGRATIPLPPGIVDAFQPAFLRRDLQLIDDRLDLDDGQQAVLKSLFADYEAAFRRGADATRDRIAEIRPLVEDPEAVRQQVMTQMRAEAKRMIGELESAAERGLSDAEQRTIRATARSRIEVLREQLVSIRTEPMVGPDARGKLEEIMTVLDEWEQERAALRADFVDDVAAMLGDVQLERWPEISRSVRRQRLLRMGELSGESIDLVGLVRALDLSPEAGGAVEPVLREYALDLDEALQQRDGAIGLTQREIYIAALEGDISQAGAAATRQIELRTAVRAVNEDFHQRLVAVLPPEAAADFTRAFLPGAYSRVYRTTEAERVLAKAAALDGLDEAAAEAIASILAEYRVELSDLNGEIAQTLREHELVALRERAMTRAARVGGVRFVRVDDPTRPLFRQRNELGNATLRRLPEVLDETQLAALPWTGWREPEEPAPAPVAEDVLQQFDLNRNGQLDPTERTEMARYLRSLKERPTQR